MGNWYDSIFGRRQAAPEPVTVDAEERSTVSTATGTTLSPGGGSAISAQEDAADFLLRKYGLDGIRAHVNAKNAMGIATFFGCVKLISNVLASMPFHVYKWEEGKGSDKDRKHSLDYILTTRFNKNMAPFVARRALIANCLVHGWAIASIKRDGLYNIKSITPYPTNKVDILYDLSTESYFFRVSEKGLVFSQDEVIFLKDLSLDGDIGHSIVNWQSQVMKVELLAKGFIEKYYEKSTFMGGIIEAGSAGGMKDEESAKMLKKRVIEAFQAGDDGGFGIAVLGMGSKFHKIGTSPVESQLLEMFDNSAKDIARSFNIPLFMLGDTEKQTSFGSGVEQMFIAVTNTVFIPMATQIEQEIDYKCFSKYEIQNGYYTKHNFKGLLRGDMKAQAEYNTKMVQTGIDTPDEIRALDEKPPLPGGVGAKPYMQGGMIAMDKMDERVPKNQGNGNGKKSPPAGSE